MCRVFYTGALKGEIGENGYNIFLNYFNNAIKENKDGFSFYNGANAEIRTLDKTHALNGLNLMREDLIKSNFIAGHCRLSTNSVKSDYIHGWNFNGFRCYHNGILRMKRENNGNDSLDFFTEIFKKKGGIIKAIKKTIKHDLQYGWGAFMFVSPTTKILLAINKECDIHIINNELLTVVSNPDIHKFKDSIDYKNKENVNIMGLKFKRQCKKSIPSKVNISDDLTARINDCLIILSDENKIVKNIPIDFKIGTNQARDKEICNIWDNRDYSKGVFMERIYTKK